MAIKFLEWALQICAVNLSRALDTGAPRPPATLIYLYICAVRNDAIFIRCDALVHYHSRCEANDIVHV